MCTGGHAGRHIHRHDRLGQGSADREWTRARKILAIAGTTGQGEGEIKRKRERMKERREREKGRERERERDVEKSVHFAKLLY